MKRIVAGIALTLAVGIVAAKEVVIDVRTPQEFAQGHVQGALNIDHSVIGQEIGKAAVAKDDTVILYCRSGQRSGKALETLKQMGFSRVENYGSLENARKRLGRQ